MTAENYIKAQLVAFSYGEGARFGGVENTMAVAQVIANRVRAGWAGGDWMRVLADAPDFAGTVYSESTVVNLRDPNFRVILQRIEDVYHGLGDDLTDGALFYAQLDEVNRPWFREHILANPETHPRTAQFGLVQCFG